MKSLFAKFFGEKKTKRLSPQERERVAFEKYARDQFKRLKDKGLGISVMMW